MVKAPEPALFWSCCQLCDNPFRQYVTRKPGRFECGRCVATRVHLESVDAVVHAARAS